MNDKFVVMQIVDDVFDFFIVNSEEEAEKIREEHDEIRAIFYSIDVDDIKIIIGCLQNVLKEIEGEKHE